jgi:hypothetical protein
MRVLIALLGFALAAASGCASQATRDAKLGPTFSAAEKELMTEEEKLAIYNSQVRAEDKLECETVKVVGSRQPQKVCQTQKEREWNRASSEDALRKSRHFQSCLATERGCQGVTGAP